MKNKYKNVKAFEQKVLMFAYGSNLLIERLEHRVGKVINLGAYDLKGYELIFDCCTATDTYANLKAKEDSYVEGVIYELTYRQLKMLDQYEGLYERYTRILEEPIELKGRKLHFYISPFRSKEFSTPIDKFYFNAIYDGAKANNLEKVIHHMETHVAPNIRRGFFNLLYNY